MHWAAGWFSEQVERMNLWTEVSLSQTQEPFDEGLGNTKKINIISHRITFHDMILRAAVF